MDILMTTWIGTSITTLMLCIGATTAAKCDRPQYLQIEQRRRLSESPNYVIRRVYLLSFFCLAILSSYVNTVGIDNLAITAVLNEASQSEVTLARSMMGNAFEGGYHWYNFFMRDGLIFLTLTLYASRSANRTSAPIAVLIFMTLCTGFSTIMATEKGLAVDFMIALFLVLAFTNNNGNLPLKGMAMLFFGVVIVLSSFYILFMGDSSIYAAIESIISRGLTGSLQPIYHYIEYFPQYHEFLYGRSFPNPGGMFPFIPYDLTVNVMNFVQPEHLDIGVIGTMPAIYWGELYANFGWLTTVIVPIFVGVLLYLVNRLALNLNRTPTSLALLVWMMIHYKNLSITSVSMFLFDLKLILMSCLYIFLTIPITADVRTAPIKKSNLELR